MPPGLTISQAAAGRSTLLAIVIAAAAGVIALGPSLFLLFRLFLQGRLAEAPEPAPDRAAEVVAARPARALAPFAGASLVAGTGRMVFLDSGWAHLVGTLCLVGAEAGVFVLATGVPDDGASQAES
jgi:cytochrome d ubiquinol oxidase subunit II